MSTNVIIVSDDVKKSRVIGDLIAGTLELHGFSDVTSTYPAYRAIEGVNDHRTALEVLQDRHPDFLKESVTIRAIPVLNYDKQHVEGMDGSNFDTEVAFLTTSVAGEGDTVVAFKERNHQSPVALNSIPELGLVVERAVKNMTEDPTGRVDLAGAAWELGNEGKLANPLSVVDQIHAVENQIGFNRIVEQIEDETLYGTSPDSPAGVAARRNAKRGRLASDRRAMFHVVPTETEE